MRETSDRRRHRLASLFLLGAVLLNPPLLGAFGVPEVLFGLPLLHLYVFGVWALLILLIALHVERRR
ncbi:MAG TPA: hypothetical protein VEB20_16635 [Azospirillaceae bacterium]|nr:hypothetical protein [Azospirillaceae bacterium]